MRKEERTDLFYMYNPNMFYNPYQQAPYNNSNVFNGNGANGNNPMFQGNNNNPSMNTSNNSLPFILINSPDEARRYIPNLNSTVYLKDTNSSLLFEKTCDSQGKTTLRVFELKEMDLGSDNKAVAKPQMATMNDLEKLSNDLNAKLEELKKGMVINNDTK